MTSSKPKPPDESQQSLLAIVRRIVEGGHWTAEERQSALASLDALAAGEKPPETVEEEEN